MLIKSGLPFKFEKVAANMKMTFRRDGSRNVLFGSQG